MRFNRLMFAVVLCVLLCMLSSLITVECMRGSETPVHDANFKFQGVSPYKPEVLKQLIAANALIYAESAGAKNTRLWELSCMVEASFVCSRIFYDFEPDKTELDRALDMLCYGWTESRWTSGCVAFNIPGYTPHVIRFSVDAYWVGLNESNLYGWRNVRSLAVELQKEGIIPFSIHLAWCPTKGDFDRVRRQYFYQVKHRVKPATMQFTMHVEELTQDDFTSALIYRIIIERSRQKAGQEWVTWDKNARRYLVKHLRAEGISVY